MSNFPEKNITKVYGSMLLALRGGGWGPVSRKKRYVILEWPHREPGTVILVSKLEEVKKS